ncbi:MAG: bifunctional phosphopantothenoylcysteine decarboxylase/phosphopantothenate--cysteine ligase CoaBC [Clostridiales bacterium]|nr:bifunctional phosphopantothenoylcysteine decarboxylase/phosphopantothenate--cysteine ligase CoaBC [Clostridiales bacterium]
MKVVLGISGSIAAYKSAEIIRLLKKRGAEVRVILTKSGAEFITAKTLETLSNYPVACDMFTKIDNYDVAHVSLAKWADVVLVAPATANIISKFVCGIADDMLSTTLLAATNRAKIVFAPAMNTQMYDSPQNQLNMQRALEINAEFIEPASGELACGDIGRGRMDEPINIVNALYDMQENKLDLVGKRFLVTAGATIEPIDPVRYITNRSSGKMGVAIANAAASRGADVTLIMRRDTTHSIHPNIELIEILTSETMYEAVHACIIGTDVFISAAAPADFTPESYCEQKIKKQDGELVLKLKKTEDILKSVAKIKGNRIHIGFAAETENLFENAVKKLKSKNLDMIAANDVSQSNCGFGYDTNAIELFFPDGTHTNSGLLSKKEVAHWLLNHAAKLFK